MKSLLNFAFYISVCLCVFGCGKQTEQDASELQRHVQALETEIADLKSNQLFVEKFNAVQWESDTNFEQRLIKLETSTTVGRQKWIVLDPTTKSYKRIDTDVGSLLVSVTGVQPFLDGYKLTLDIGNPYAMDFNGFGVSCKWSVPPTYTNGVYANEDEVEKSEKSKESNQTEVLHGGSWNAVELTITPATAEEMKMLRISIKPNTIALIGRPSL